MDNHNYSPSQQKGFSIEHLACDYLKKNNLILIHKNFRSRFGEIDLIMKDHQTLFPKNTLVFVEVRYRKSQAFGGALESVSHFKQKKLINTAQMYLLKYHAYNTPPCRFDVVLVTGKLTQPNIQWIVNAFE
jgi:putative endonuclease